MRLSQKERDIIACSIFQADLSTKQISAQSGYRQHVVRNCLSRLRDRGVISLRAVINPFALGFSEYEVLFTFASPDSVQQTRLVEMLVGSQFTTYVGTVGGDFQLFAMFLSRNAQGVLRFFDQLNFVSRGARYEKAVGVCAGVTLYQPKYLSRRKSSIGALSYTTVERPVRIDELDHQILNLMGSGEHASLASIARALHVAAATVSYRVASLRKSGVIIGLGYSVPLFSDGFLPYSLFLFAKGGSSALDERLSRFCSAHQSVTYLMRSIANWDYQVGISVEDPRMVDGVIRNLYSEFAADLTRIVQVPRLKVLKLNPYPLKQYSTLAGMELMNAGKEAMNVRNEGPLGTKPSNVDRKVAS